MAAVALFPQAIDQVTTWLEDPANATAVTRLPGKEKGKYCRVWQLNESPPILDGSPILFILKQDFPTSPARIEFDKKLCFRLPHVEGDGHFCHGILPHPQDVVDPVAAVGEILSRLQSFLEECNQPGWIEAEFSKESGDYWKRYAETKPHAKYKLRELLLDVDLQGKRSVVVPTQALSSRLLASTGDPVELAKRYGWAVSTVARGRTLVVKLPQSAPWTPSIWPQDFGELDDFLSSLLSEPNALRTWYRQQRHSPSIPVIVVLDHGSALYGWFLCPPASSMAQPVLLPIEVNRIDRRWALSRDYRTDKLDSLTGKRVVVFGCGSLGSPTIELLARGGVGCLEIVDPQAFEAENISRHTLDMQAIGCSKSEIIKRRIVRIAPDIHITSHPIGATDWCAQLGDKHRPDLIIDCSGERSVRMALSLLRTNQLNGIPLMMAWMEPFCAAAHVIMLNGMDAWPSADPAETHINFATWPHNAEIKLPGCGQGFHPYGMSDSIRAAGLVAERALAFLQGEDLNSAVWSFVRSQQYFESQAPGVTFNRPIPTPADAVSITIRRPLEEALNESQ
jgi:hypothetical protein